MEQQLRAIILDVDGTLVDSNDAHAQAWIDTFQEFGIEVPFERVRRLIGMGGDKLLPQASGIEEDSDLGKRMSERRSDIFQDRYVESLQPTSGARQLVLALLDRGVKVAIATSAKEDELQRLLKQCQCDDLIELRVCSDDADHSKPDPDIVEAAVQRLGIPGSEVVMVGDTPYDIQAAAAAGVSTIAVRSGGWDDANLKAAIAIYDHPAALLADLDRWF